MYFFIEQILRTFICYTPGTKPTKSAMEIKLETAINS